MLLVKLIILATFRLPDHIRNVHYKFLVDSEYRNLAFTYRINNNKNNRINNNNKK